MKLFAEEGLGRKFVGLGILFVMLIVGALVLKEVVEMYKEYAKWAVVGYGVFVGGNAGITVSSILKKNGGNENVINTKKKIGT